MLCPANRGQQASQPNCKLPGPAHLSLAPPQSYDSDSRPPLKCIMRCSKLHFYAPSYRPDSISMAHSAHANPPAAFGSRSRTDRHLTSDAPCPTVAALAINPLRRTVHPCTFQVHSVRIVCSQNTICQVIQAFRKITKLKLTA